MSSIEPLLFDRIKKRADELNIQSVESAAEQLSEAHEPRDEDYLDVLFEINSETSAEKMESTILPDNCRNIKLYPELNVIAAEIPFHGLIPLKHNPSISGIYDGIGEIKHCLDISVPMISCHDLIELPDELPETGESPKGKGIKVCVIDTGIDSEHPDLLGRIEEIKDFTPDADGIDYDGHGTHVASTIAGSGESSRGRYRGVAPEAELYIAKIFDKNLATSRRIIIEALLWAIEKKVDVINMSLGDSSTTRDGTCPLCKTVDYVSSHGIFVACAAGNEAQSPDGVDFGSGTITCPGNANTAFTVGAVSKDKKVAGFSSRGPTADGREKPDAIAPGVDISAAALGGKYQSLSGTSMSTPHVAGAGAILQQLYKAFSQSRGLPDVLKPSEMKNALKAGAHKISNEQDGNTQGAGLINIPAAFHWLELHKLGAKVTTKSKKRRARFAAEFIVALFILIALGTFLYTQPIGYQIERYITARFTDGRDTAVETPGGTIKPDNVTKSELSQEESIAESEPLTRSEKVSIGTTFDFSDTPKEHDFSADIRRLVEHVDTHPESIDSLASLLVYLSYEEETDDIISILNGAVERNGGNAGLMYNLGLTYYQNGQLDNAKECMEAVLDLEPSNSSADFLLASINEKIDKNIDINSDPIATTEKSDTAGSALPEANKKSEVNTKKSTTQALLDRWETLDIANKIHIVLLNILVISGLIYLLAHLISRNAAKGPKGPKIADTKESISVRSISKYAFHTSLASNSLLFLMGILTLIVSALRMNKYLGEYIRDPKSFLDLLATNKVFLGILILFVVVTYIQKSRKAEA